MRLGFALSVLLTASVAGVGAGLAVFFAWSRMTGLPDSVSPALWAARTYLSYFDLWALMAFLPCCTVVSWICSRLDSDPALVTSGAPRCEPEFPLQEAL